MDQTRGRSNGNVLIPTPGSAIPAYLAIPSSTDPCPGVVVLHDVGGMSQDLRNQANWLAADGFLAAAPELYHRGGLISCMRTIMRDCMARIGPTFDDIEATRSWLSCHPASNGRVGVIGFCMGGGIALLLVSGRNFSAASINYGGRLPDDIEGLLRAACPIIGSYGAKDRWNRGVAAEIERALERAQVPHDVKEYPDAGHSFMNNKETFWFKALRFAGIAYDEQAALDARRRIASFFHRHLQA
jgi:carboxymethylenebutenolidase